MIVIINVLITFCVFILLSNVLFDIVIPQFTTGGNNDIAIPAPTASIIAEPEDKATIEKTIPTKIPFNNVHIVERVYRFFISSVGCLFLLK